MTDAPLALATPWPRRYGTSGCFAAGAHRRRDPGGSPHSPVNHVGMVVALDDLPPLLWHAELGRSATRCLDREAQRGVQLQPLGEAVRTWTSATNPLLGSPARSAISRRQRGTAHGGHEHFDGRPSPRRRAHPALGVRSLRRGRRRWRRSTAPSSSPRPQHMGLLPSKRPRAGTTPGLSGAATTSSSWQPFALRGEMAVLS